MTTEPTVLTGTGPGGLSYRVVLALSDTGHMVGAIRLAHDPRLVVAHPPITDAPTAEALAIACRLAEHGADWRHVP